MYVDIFGFEMKSFNIRHHGKTYSFPGSTIEEFGGLGKQVDIENHPVQNEMYFHQDNGKLYYFNIREDSGHDGYLYYRLLRYKESDKLVNRIDEGGILSRAAKAYLVPFKLIGEGTKLYYSEDKVGYFLDHVRGKSMGFGARKSGEVGDMSERFKERAEDIGSYAGGNASTWAKDGAYYILDGNIGKDNEED